MPFVEIVKGIMESYVYIRKNGVVTISKDLRDNFVDERIRIYVDEENGLLGLASDDEGYTLVEEKFTCRKLPRQVPPAKYKAKWDAERGMIIVDFNSK